MEITAPNSTDPKNDLTTQHRWTRKWQRKAVFLQRIIDRTRVDLAQAYKDYDQVEGELRALLSVNYSITPNATLMAMSHEDLAIYADQLRVKCLRLSQVKP